MGDAVSPIVDGDDGSSSVVGVAIGGGTDLLSDGFSLASTWPPWQLAHACQVLLVTTSCHIGG